MFEETTTNPQQENAPLPYPQYSYDSMLRVKSLSIQSFCRVASLARTSACFIDTATVKRGSVQGHQLAKRRNHYHAITRGDAAGSGGGAGCVLALRGSMLGQRKNLSLADSIIDATAQHARALVWTQDSNFENLPGVRFWPMKRA